jgi:hypothetical protein
VIARLNGDFKRHYGRLLGAYLRSVTATRGRSYFLSGLWFAGLSVAGVGCIDRVCLGGDARWSIDRRHAKVLRRP